MISFIIPLFFLLGITLTNSIIFNKEFEYSLPVAIMECILITYLAGFFNLFIGFSICILLSLSSIPLFYIGIKKTTYSPRRYFFTNLFGVFILLYFIIFTLNLGKSFSHWDDFSHWGVMVKEMLRLNRYYYLKESVLEYHKEYPPLTGIFQYIWCRLCVVYKERNLFNAKNILCLSLFFPILGDIFIKERLINKKLERLFIILILSLFLITLGIVHPIGEASFYRSIYVEPVLTSLFILGSYSLSIQEKFKKFNIISNTLILSCLLLTKQIAIYFFVILFLIFILHSILNQGWQIFKKFQIYKFTLINFGIPLILRCIWSVLTNIYAPAGQFDTSKFSIQNIISLVQGHAEDFQSKTIQLYFSSIWKTPLISKPFSISYVGIIILFIVFFVMLYLLERDKKNKIQIISIGICQIIGALGYIAVMLLSYLYGFSVDESLSLACFNRYMSTIICPILIITLILIIKLLTHQFRIRPLTLISITLLVLYLLFIPWSITKDELLPGFFNEKTGEVFYGDCDIIQKNTPENSRIFFICQKDIGGGRNIIAYETIPRRISTSYFSLGAPYDEKDIYTKNISIDDLTLLLKDFDYIYLSNIDEQFKTKYGTVFDPVIDIKNQQLYKINISDTSKLTLEQIKINN